MAEDQGKPEAEAAPPREPAIRAPWPVLLLSGSFLALYALQSTAVSPEAVAARFAFSPLDLTDGRWGGLITAMFVHGGWPHVILNALGALAFGTPIARLFARDARGGAISFFVFFLVCGVLSSLGYAMLHWRAPYMLVGASGGVSGLMGAASRLIDRRSGLAPFRSRTVVSMAVAWVLVNLAIGVVGLGGVSGGAPIAWEAHLAGYFAGLFLLAPALKLFTKA